MPEIFIGMPVYNGELFIREALNSILNQTYQNWKLLISDDASQDATQNIISEYVKNEPRITYIRQEKNLGLFENFKFTLNKAHSPYFMWAAQDDMWNKDYLTTCINIFQTNKKLGLVTTCNETIDSFGRRVLISPWMHKLSGAPSAYQVAKYILEPEGLGKCNLMYGLFKTEVVQATWKAYPQRNTWGQDYIFSLALIARFNVEVSPEILFKKRLGGFSSPQLALKDRTHQITNLLSGNPKNHMFPLGRFRVYFAGHMEALKGTPYRTLGAICLIIRLPRAAFIHIKERNIKKFIFRLVKK